VDDVDVAAGGLAERLRERIAGSERAEVDRRIRAELPRPLQHLGVTPRRHHAAGAEQPRRLHRELADDAGRAQHEHRLARSQPRAPRERQPGRQPGHAKRHRNAVVELVRQRDRLLFPDQRALGERAERRHGAAEVHAPSVAGDSPDALAAHHRGQRRRTGDERA
jgi:hypothetical protein